MDENNPREMFDKLPEPVWLELKAMAKDISHIIGKYYDAHTEVRIAMGELMIKRDVLNVYVK